MIRNNINIYIKYIWTRNNINRYIPSEIADLTGWSQRLLDTEII